MDRRWKITKQGDRPELPWVLYYTHPYELHGDTDLACLDGSEHATGQEAYAAYLHALKLWRNDV